MWAALVLGLLAASPAKVVVLGGTGRIGTACAAHLLRAADVPLALTLAGRDASRGEAAVAEVTRETPGTRGTVAWSSCDLGDERALAELIDGAAALVHTAGPFDADPAVLRAAIRARVPAYVDVADPLGYIDTARRELSEPARAAGTHAVIAAGAFPGLSNLLAMETASRLGEPVKDLDFSYFTAGLGGAGEVNLRITNKGFGDEVGTWRAGRPAPSLIGGTRLRTVDYFLSTDDPSASRVGSQPVWAWPFPEVSTVAAELGISGDSSTGMGTAPQLWNVIIEALVSAVPRRWWSDYPRWSNGLATFSRPLVAITDPFVGETHAMRVDVRGESGRAASAVHAHESFRRVVGGCAAEFVLGMMRQAADGVSAGGVCTPEQLPTGARAELLRRMLALDGTLNWGVTTTDRQ